MRIQGAGWNSIPPDELLRPTRSAASSASAPYGTGNPLETIVNAGRIGRRRRRRPANVGLEICAKHE
jgi:hypothetical protein